MTDKSVVPEGMVAWAGGDGPPSDLAEGVAGKVMYRDGVIQYPVRAHWKHRGGADDIIAYTPKSNPLSLETSDLDPITPEEDALATKAIVAMGWTRQSYDSAVRMVRVVLAELIDRVAEMDMQALASVVHDARWDQGSAASSWVPYSAEYGSGKVYSMRIANAVQMHLLHMLSAHSIQSGGEGGEG